MFGFMRSALIAGLLGLSSAPLQAQSDSASLTIRIENVSPRGGILRLGLYDRAAYPDNDSKPAASADVTAEPGETIITLKHLMPGVYAIETFQDINANGRAGAPAANSPRRIGACQAYLISIRLRRITRPRAIRSSI